jgi:hypothetical protein
MAMRNFGKIYRLIAVMGLLTACLVVIVRKPAAVSLLPGTPAHELRLLLKAIDEKNWLDACTHLSTSFLAKNQQSVIEGTYFARTGKQDRTCIYIPEMTTITASRLGPGGTTAVVTLQIGKSDTLWDQLLRRPPHKRMWPDVQLVKENGQWKVDDF